MKIVLASANKGKIAEFEKLMPNDEVIAFSEILGKIEIDEDQHVGYATLCDNRRTMELFDDLGQRPIVFIRLNPDKYSLDGKTTRVCFNQTKDGNLKTMPTEFGNRFSALQDALEHAIHHGVPSRELTYVKLFYSD